MDKTFSASKFGIKNQQGRTLFETLLVIIMVAILMLIAIERFWTSARFAQEAALQIELANVRRAVSFYLITKGRLPESLRQMTQEKVVVPKQDTPIMLEWPYIQSMSADEEGYLLDTFGNRYIYDPKTGMVKSGTKGYEMW